MLTLSGFTALATQPSAESGVWADSCVRRIATRLNESIKEVLQLYVPPTRLLSLPPTLPHHPRSSLDVWTLVWVGAEVVWWE